MNKDFSGDPIFIIEFIKDGVKMFKTYPHNVEAATLYIEYKHQVGQNASISQ